LWELKSQQGVANDAGGEITGQYKTGEKLIGLA